jgi:hypothetical protein
MINQALASPAEVETNPELDEASAQDLMGARLAGRPVLVHDRKRPAPRPLRVSRHPQRPPDAVSGQLFLAYSVNWVKRSTRRYA